MKTKLIIRDIVFNLIITILLSIIVPLFIALIDRITEANVNFNQFQDRILFGFAIFLPFFLIWFLLSFLYDYFFILNRKGITFSTAVIVQLVIGAIVTIIFSMKYSYWMTSFGNGKSSLLLYSLFLVGCSLAIAASHYLFIDKKFKIKAK